MAITTRLKMHRNVRLIVKKAITSIKALNPVIDLSDFELCGAEMEPAISVKLLGS